VLGCKSAAGTVRVHRELVSALQMLRDVPQLDQLFFSWRLSGSSRKAHLTMLLTGTYIPSLRYVPVSHMTIAQIRPFGQRYAFVVVAVIFLSLLIAAGLRDQAGMMRALERAFTDRSGWMVFLAVEPEFSDVRQLPEFRRLLARVKPLS
jgi:hypothetical protein